MKLTTPRLIMIIIGAIAIIAVGLYLFLYGPLINRLKPMRLECKTIEADVLQIRDGIASVRTTDIKRDLIPEEEVSLAINELTRQAKLEGIDLISMTSRKIEKSEGAPYGILPIEMEIESTYEKLGMFLGSLDELEKSLITVRKFNIAPDGEDPEKLKTELVINMFLKSENAE